jgi:AcrR family transcriptional regulator
MTTRRRSAAGARGARARRARGDAGPQAKGARRLPAGRHGLSREEVVNSQRQRLLDSMAALCAEQGYAAATIAKIVKGAGVSRATFYELFRDKEDCFVATMEEGLRRLVGAVMPAVYAPSESMVDKVREVVSALLDYLASDPDYSITAMVEAAAGGERAFERYSAGTQIITSLLDQARAIPSTGGRLPSTTARAVFGAGESLIANEMMNGRVDRVPQLIPDLVYLSLVPYVGQEEALRQMAAAAADLRPPGASSS